MKKRVLMLTLAFLMLFASVCEAEVNKNNYYMFGPPYEEIPDARSMQNIPTVLTVDSTAYKVCVASVDTFAEDAEYSDFYSYSFGEATFEDGALKFVKTDTTGPHSASLTYYPSEPFVEGDTYAFTCYVKTVGLEGSSVRNIIVARDPGNAWLTEVSTERVYEGDNDWTKITQYLTVPTGTARIGLQAYVPTSATGTVYFKDFKLYKIGSDPMDVVLRRPNYKGLIYGDGYGDIDLDIVLRQQTDIYEYDKMSLRVQLVDKDDNVIYYADSTKLSDRMNYVFSSAGLAEGDYYMQGILKDLEGNVIHKEETTIRKRAADYRPRTYVDENAHFIDKDGEKKFLINLYNHGDTSMTASSSTTPIIDDTVYLDMDAISEYGGGWWLIGKNRDDTKLNQLISLGKRIHINLAVLAYGTLSESIGMRLLDKIEDTVPLISEIVGEYADKEYLLGYYLYDEPYPLIRGEEFRWLNEILAEFDIDNPTFGTGCYDYDEYGVYVKMADFLGVDPYPIKGKTDDEGNPIDDIAEVGRIVRETKKNFPNRPVTLVLQTFNWKSQGSGYSSCRTPTDEELRNMMWQGLCEGAESLDGFSYPSLYLDEDRTSDEWRLLLKNLFAEARKYEDVLMSDEPSPIYQVEGGGEWLNLSVKRYNGKTYIFATNNTYNDGKSATVKINGVDEPIELTFDSLDVQIREISHADYLSPEAELEIFGVANGDKAYSILKEENENILCVPRGTDILDYTLVTSEGAKAYFGPEELGVTGRMTIRNMDEFTVTVVAEDGITKTHTTYKILRQ